MVGLSAFQHRDHRHEAGDDVVAALMKSTIAAL
jgi:hypothetical protein